MRIRSMSKAMMVIALSAITLNANSQKIDMPAPSPLQTLTQKFGLGEITLEYSRPSVKGRKIFGDIVPFGKIWRTGANATTKITFTDDVQLEGNAVKAGTYGIYTVPNKDSWEIMLYSDLALNGNVAEYKTENEVLRIKVKTTNIPFKIETMMFSFDDVTSSTANLAMLWENTVITIKVSTDIDSKVMKSIDESMKSDKPDYFRAAGYYFDNGKDMNQALTWVTKATEENPKAFYMMLLKAKIEYKLGNKAAGKASAEKTIELAKEAKNDDYIALANKLLEENKK